MTETQIQRVHAEEGGYVVSCNQIPRWKEEDLALETAVIRDFNDTWVLSHSFLPFFPRFWHQSQIWYPQKCIIIFM